MAAIPSSLGCFHPAVAEWFASSFAEGPTPPQVKGWPPIVRGDSTLIVAPTGSGKTLAAFLGCLDRLMFGPAVSRDRRCRVVYVSPLKALAVDVDRNLRVPLAGIAHHAERRGDALHLPEIAIRTGDTPARERSRFRRRSADLLITTPESLHLLLTSDAREMLRGVETVIVDEIHALVPTKRGAHLALSLERLEHLAGHRLQRIGLSATQRPLDLVAGFLGGVERSERHEIAVPAAASVDPGCALHAALDTRAVPFQHRPVSIVDARFSRPLDLRIEVPVEDLSKLDRPDTSPGRIAAQPSIWSAIHPRLVELVRAHRSTLVFVNSRRLAERLAAALNDLAGETLALAHHGSIAREQRLVVEERLKAGQLRALVATSSLELGIDMGAIDLVVQIEAPLSVSSGLQRVGRAGHRMGETIRGTIFPKYRGDLLACAAIARAMRDGEVETVRYPVNPLDVLAQQIVAMVAVEAWDVETLWRVVRRAAPFAALPRFAFESVLDLLSGRHATDDLASLRPRITWDRESGMLTTREGARLTAVLNAGTIPDRGLYAVHLAGAAASQARVGELDEEMVFESAPGETFLLGASTWRIEQITHDRVLVSPAPGEPGKMPFWKGEALGRPVELGRRIGRLARELLAMPRASALHGLERDHGLDARAASNLVQYLEEQRAATRSVPDDRTIVVERVRDEMGDWRVCVLSPLGGQVLAPWAMAVMEKVHAASGIDVETMWTNEGFVVRFPDSDVPPDPAWLIPTPDELEDLVLARLGGTALFAARFREIAGRALLLPRRRAGRRAPLWQLRKRAHDLLSVASRMPSFPMILETWRECLRDALDLPSLRALLESIAVHDVRVEVVDSAVPSPFASAILFGYVAQYLYDGDTPLAERRAQALTVDPVRLRELLGDAELRELLDADAIAAVERELQHLEVAAAVRSRDGLHDLLLRLGALDPAEIRARCASDAVAGEIDALVAERRALLIDLAGCERVVAIEHASRWRDAVGAVLPADLPPAFLTAVPDPLADLLLRHARTHGPFTAQSVSARFGLSRERATHALHRLVADGRLLEGAFLPAGTSREWCDPDVLRRIRLRSLARLRRAVEPVEPPVLARFSTHWHGVVRRQRGLDAILDVVERLQGAPLPASLLEREILPARIEHYDPGELDVLCAAGEIVWTGVDRLGEHDGRVALFLSDALPRLRLSALSDDLGALEERLLEVLRRDGASFFAPLHAAIGGGFVREVVDALWSLVWKGLVTNDGFHALRAWARPPSARGRSRAPARSRVFRSRRSVPPAAEGRWSVLDPDIERVGGSTAWATASAQQLLARHGIVTRETALAEGVPGGFAALRTVLQGMEEAGRARRGWFVSGVSATQFALPAALDELRRLRAMPETPEVVTLSACDPASPWGAVLPWPARCRESKARHPARAVGATVVLVNGALAAWLARSGRQLSTWLPPDDTEQGTFSSALARALADHARRRARDGCLIAEIDGVRAFSHRLAPALEEAGFVANPQGFQLRALASDDALRSGIDA